MKFKIKNIFLLLSVSVSALHASNQETDSLKKYVTPIASHHTDPQWEHTWGNNKWIRQKFKEDYYGVGLDPEAFYRKAMGGRNPIYVWNDSKKGFLTPKTTDDFDFFLKPIIQHHASNTAYDATWGNLDWVKKQYYENTYKVGLDPEAFYKKAMGGKKPFIHWDTSAATPKFTLPITGNLDNYFEPIAHHHRTPDYTTTWGNLDWIKNKYKELNALNSMTIPEFYVNAMGGRMPTMEWDHDEYARALLLTKPTGQTLLQQGIDFYQARSFSQAIDLFKQVLHFQDTNLRIPAMGMLGRICYALNKNDKARTCFLKAIALYHKEKGLQPLKNPKRNYGEQERIVDTFISKNNLLNKGQLSSSQALKVLLNPFAYFMTPTLESIQDYLAHVSLEEIQKVEIDPFTLPDHIFSADVSTTLEQDYFDLINKIRGYEKAQQYDYTPLKSLADLLVRSEIQKTLKSKKAEEFTGARLRQRLGLDPQQEEGMFQERPVGVGVIDSGFDPFHPLLKDRFSEGYNAREQNSDVNASEVLDIHHHDYKKTSSHGTHVAGIVTQVAPSSVSVIPVKIGARHNRPQKAMQEAFRNLMKRDDVNIINISMGLDFSDQTLRQLALDLVNRNKLLVVAAGNDGRSLDKDHRDQALVNLAADPAMKGRLIIVGSTSQHKAGEFISSFSNKAGKDGAAYFICAPGRDIESSVPLNRSAEKGTAKNSGTSMAAPVVSGCLAKLLAENPHLTLDEVRNIIFKTADKGSTSHPYNQEEYGSGVINFRAAQAEAFKSWSEIRKDFSNVDEFLH